MQDDDDAVSMSSIEMNQSRPQHFEFDERESNSQHSLSLQRHSAEVPHRFLVTFKLPKVSKPAHERVADVEECLHSSVPSVRQGEDMLSVATPESLAQQIVPHHQTHPIALPSIAVASAESTENESFRARSMGLAPFKRSLNGPFWIR